MEWRTEFNLKECLRFEQIEKGMEKHLYGWLNQSVVVAPFLGRRGTILLSCWEHEVGWGWTTEGFVSRGI